MQQVEVVNGSDLGHPGRESEVVGRVLEQRVLGDLDLVIVDIWSGGGQADGLRVSDEMDFVATLSELDAEFRGNDAAAAVGGITGDADFHDGSWLPALGY